MVRRIRLCSNNTPKPIPSTPKLFETVSRPRTPSSSPAAISAWGMPHRPNPPTASDDPSVTSATASAVVATTLSIVTSLSSASFFGHAEDALGDDIALDECRPAGDGGAARLIGQPQPPLLVGR